MRGLSWWGDQGAHTPQGSVTVLSQKRRVGGGEQQGAWTPPQGSLEVDGSPTTEARRDGKVSCQSPRPWQAGRLLRPWARRHWTVPLEVTPGVL